MQNTLLKVKNLTKEYNNIAVLKNIDFEINKGEFVVLLGAGSSGKSTLLNILGAMETTSYGEIIYDNITLNSLSKMNLTKYRATDIGFIFQSNKLISNLTAIENIDIATLYCSSPLPSLNVLNDVGLSDKAYEFPKNLSGGEQQRLGIARAIAKNPKLLLCDEPTSSLDYSNSERILKLLQTLCKKNNSTVLFATSNSNIACIADKIIKINNGALEEIIINTVKIPVERIEW